jgi:iron complex outermembrane recepter protein
MERVRTSRYTTAMCMAIALHGGSAYTQQADATLGDLLSASGTPAGDAPPASYDTIPLPVASDDAPATERPRRGLAVIEEIVVTAQKREESLNDVPIAISAFSGEDLRALGITDTRDLGAIVPGFSFAESGYSVPIYALRGVGFNEASQTASATVGIYADEQNLAFPVFSKGANLDLARVEVLKGPQGTLYGRNTTGGAINYIANTPTDAFETGFNASYGRFSTLDAEAYVSGPLSDTLRARIAYRLIRATEGWQYSLTRPDDRLGEIDKHSARITLDWQPGDDWTTVLTLSGWLDRGEPQAPQVIGFQPQNAITAGLLRDLGLPQEMALQPEVRDHPTVPFDTDDNRVADWSDLPWHNDERFWMAALRNDWAFGEHSTLTVLASYAHFRNDHSLIPQTGLSVNNTERDLDVDTSAWALEARVDGLWGEGIDWMVGAYLSRDSVYEYQSVYLETDSAAFIVPLPVLGNLIGPLVADRADTSGEQDARTHAAFASIGWPLGDALRLTTGLRYTREVRDFAGCTRDSPHATQGVGFRTVFNVLSLLRGGSGGAGVGDCVTLDSETGDPSLYVGRLDEDNLSGRLALDWTTPDDHLLYASYSRGFKSGSFPVLAASDHKQYEPAVQEQLDAWELGAKTNWLDAALRITLAAFWYDYRDKQLLGRTYDEIFGPLPILVNAPKSRVYGAEAEIQATPLDGLFLSLAASWLDTKVIEGTTLDQSGDEVDLAGRPFNFAPRWSLSAIAAYTRPLTATLDLDLAVDASWRDDTNSVLTEDPLFAIDGYALLNARVGIAAVDGGWSLSAWGRNLTDQFYSNGTFNTGDTISRYAGMPRTYGLSLSVRWQ